MEKNRDLRKTVSTSLLFVFFIATLMPVFGVGAVSARAAPLAFGEGRLRSADDVTSMQFDEQLGLCFGQNSTSLAYNVTAVQQEDSNGYGPGYLLNAYTDAGYWYQVGIYYNWPNTDWVDWPAPPSNVPGFGLGYEVWDNEGNSVFPTDGGGGLANFTGTVNAGDNVLLNLYLSSGNVTMYAYDWNTGASAQETYTAEGASLFIGATQGPSGDLRSAPWVYFFGPGYFTGLMTEWVHPVPYYGGEEQVVYQNENSSLYLGYLWADEWDPNNGTSLFNNGEQVSFLPPNSDQLQNFTTNGAAEAANAYLFITGEPTADVSPGSVTMDIGQSQLFSASVLGGVSPYTFQWYLDGAVVSGATGALWMFTPTSAGSYTVYVEVTDSVGAHATSDSANVTVNNVTVNVHDVAVFSLSPNKTVVGQSYGLNMSVVAANLGDYVETFNVTIYANETYATSENVTLQNQTSTNLILTWNTTGFAYGNYTISAYAWPVANETNTANNNCTSGNVIITIPGDVNGDFKVDMKDIALLARAFGSTPGSSNWNPNCDINGDGRVDMRDVALAARHFGQ